MKKINLSIVIVNYNTGKLLEKCLESIQKTTQEFRTPKTEVIIVDNASRDNSVGFLKKQKLTRDVVLIENKENLGFAKAANQGLKKSKGEHKLLLNPDTEIKNRAIQELLDFAKSAKDAGVVAPRLLNPDGSRQSSVFRFPSLMGAIREFWLRQEGFYSKYLPQGDHAVKVDAVVGAAFLITPEAFKRVGFLDERYFMYFEDLDYCRRIKMAGLRVYYLPKAEVIHYHGASGKSLAKFADQWRRLIPSSKIYHGVLKHYLLNFVIWFGVRVLQRR